MKGFRADAKEVKKKLYKNSKRRINTTVKKSWVYLRRAHLHSQTMGVIAIVFSMLTVWLSFPKNLQMGVSLLSGFGSLGYGIFWFSAGWLAPGMGGTNIAKASVEWIAIMAGGCFFLAVLSMAGWYIYVNFLPARFWEPLVNKIKRK